MFFDKVKITIKSGDGGDGMASFKSFSGIAHGGPDGGDGGKGGDIYVIGDKDKTDLVDFRFGNKFIAENGERGGTNNCFGRGGKDIVIALPLGTIVRDAESGKIICDVYTDGEKKCIYKGGNGGKGNVRFTSSIRHAPHFAQKGEKTKAHEIFLELKIIADVGLIGFPNVGKSTLLSKISAARPKIANYHFTTLSPNLGVVKQYDSSFVVADIPGLIEGASTGAGLGHAFLRHIERTRMLVHVIDIAGTEGRDPFEDYLQINKELKAYSPKLASLPQIVVLNKCDCDIDNQKQMEFKRKCKKIKIFAITAVNGNGTKPLITHIFKVLASLPKPEPIPSDDFTFAKADVNEFLIEYVKEDKLWIVTGGLVEMLERNVVLSDPDSMAYFQKILKDKGVIRELKKQGIQDDDIVNIGGIAFEFKE